MTAINEQFHNVARGVSAAATINGVLNGVNRSEVPVGRCGGLASLPNCHRTTYGRVRNAGAMSERFAKLLVGLAVTSLRY